MEKYTDAKKNLSSQYGSNVSLVITPELELCLCILTPSEGKNLITLLLKTIRGEDVDPEYATFQTARAYDYFTGPDYNIKDLILPRLSNDRA